MATVEERKRQLEARIEEINIRLHEIEAELVSHNSRDWEDRATQREPDEVLEDEGRAGNTEIVAIRAALDRIEQGTYGECVICGEQIEEARLDLIPHTPFCARDAHRIAR
ncbi:TraR/DksA family transcriptional regulator [Tropicimonas sp.]|uniref:TraR/DksA family transcriptional regulator n=1 Tax=Tropicimonas sp. TaxID=2067044 RepID=UPI003A8C28ED